MMEKNISINGDIRSKNGLTTNYTISSVDSNSTITIIERFYSRNEKDFYSYSERYNGENGLVVVSADSELGIDLTGNIGPQRTEMKVEYFKNETIEQAKENKCEAKADVSTSNVINLIPMYHSKLENIRFGVEKTKKNGEKKYFTFAYPTDPDFRQQLRNLFHSLVAVSPVEYGIISLASMDHDIMPEEIGVFDANKYVNSYNMKKIETNQKQAIKK